ncbi:MAG: archease [Calditrichota bacterium]
MPEHASPPFTTFEHSGDLGIRAAGQDFYEALANASAGLMSQVIEGGTVDDHEDLPVSVDGNDSSDQAIALLNEILYLAYGKGWLTGRVRQLTSCSRTGCQTLDAHLSGESLDPARHHFRREIKAVTYHGFTIRQEHGLTIIEFICDL